VKPFGALQPSTRAFPDSEEQQRVYLAPALANAGRLSFPTDIVDKTRCTKNRQVPVTVSVTDHMRQPGANLNVVSESSKRSFTERLRIMHPECETKSG